ncbi:MAG TPA: 50S ribosomal protein L25/general stress protein Ctc [Microbacteriaceae bacterium]|nr:50S ribosomal protein L25/general stress protein Ctc [Microbacteriaceae bacterium]
MAELSNHIAADNRESFGKGAARKLRAAGKIPAVIYGHGTEPRHVALPGHQTGLLIRKANAIIELLVDGKQELTLVKDVQRDPVRQIIEHIDLVVVKKGEKVHVDVPVHIEGEAAPGTNVLQDANSISIEVEATHIPERLTISVEGLDIGAHITAGQVELPAGATLLSDPELLIIGVTGQTVAAEVEEAAAEAEAEAAAEAGEAAAEEPAAE